MSDATSSASRQSEQVYPVVYKVVTWVRILTLAVTLVFGLGWIFMSFYPSYAQGHLVLDPVLISIDVPVLAGIIYSIAWAFTARITLYADRFEQRKPLVYRTLFVSDIAGRRYTTGRAAGYPVIVPKSGAALSIDTSSYGLDERFTEWFLRLPDLPKIERERNLERVKKDASLGATPSERIAADASRQRTFRFVGGCLAAATFVTFYASTFIHDHLDAFIVVNAVLPWLALLLVLSYKDQAAGPDSSKSGFVVVPLYIPAASLAMLAIQHTRVLDVKGVIACGFVAALILTFALLGLLRKLDSSISNKWVVALAMLPFTWLYSGSLLALGNSALDGQPSRVVPTEVMGKYVQRGKSGRSYFLEIASGNGIPESATVRVQGDQYIRIREGDVICMALYPGRFGFPWMQSTNCPGKDGPF
jgi:hypothetical protein